MYLPNSDVNHSYSSNSDVNHSCCCLRAFILSCFITQMFLLLHSRDKTAFTSLAVWFSWSFRGVSSEISTLFLSFFKDFAMLIMFSAICSGSVDIFQLFVPQCKMTLLGARSTAGWIYDSLSFVVVPPKNLIINFSDSFNISQPLISLMTESPMITETFLFFEFLLLLLMLFCIIV